MTNRYVLTAAAEADIGDTVRYTRKQWGEVQARRYLAKLTLGIERGASGEGPSKVMGEFHPGLRVVRCGASLHFLPAAGKCACASPRDTP